VNTPRAQAMATLLLASLVSFAIACRKEEDPSVWQKKEAQAKAHLQAKYRSSIDPKLARIAAIRDVLDETPPASEDAAPPSTSPRIKLRELHFHDDDTNADLNLRSEIASLERGILGTCGAYLRSVPDEVESYTLEGAFEGCTRMRYYLVVRPDVHVKAELSKTKQDKYVGGLFEGDVVVYDLDSTAKPSALGAFRVRADLTKPVEVRIDDTHDIVEYELNEELRHEVVLAVESKINAAAKTP